MSPSGALKEGIFGAAWWSVGSISNSQTRHQIAEMTSCHYRRSHHSRSSRGRGGHYGKRDVVDNEIEDDGVEHELSLLNLLEPDQCFHRLLCDLSTGRMPQSPIDFIASMFTGERRKKD